jgi:hypothetical protein
VAFESRTERVEYKKEIEMKAVKGTPIIYDKNRVWASAHARILEI